jgi:hypothetical protein
MRRLLGCILSPRLVLLIVWMFTDYTEAAYQDADRTWLLILGFLFLPATALAWALIVHFGNGDSRWGPAVLTAVALFELGLLTRWFRGERKPPKE